MDDKSKLMLSEEELEIVNNTKWILTKQDIIQKVYQQFSNMVPEIRKEFLNAGIQFPDKIISAIPKISRGENYNGLPYVLLDYPSVFDKDEMFAFRTMFWWGNFFSVSLLLSGKYKDLFAEKILAKSVEFSKDLFICVHDNPWQHHFEQTNYIVFYNFEKTQVEDLINQKDFLKIALKFELKQWNNIDSLLKDACNKLISLIKD